MGTPRGIAWSLARAGGSAKNMGSEEAQVWLHQALTHFRELDDPNGVSFVLPQIGDDLQYRGKFRESIPYLQEGLQLAIEIGNLRRIVFAHILLGGANTGLGRYPEARIHLEQALTLNQETRGGQFYNMIALETLGKIALAEGAFPEAQEIAQQTLRMIEEQGRGNINYASIQALAGYTARALGETISAQHYYTVTLQAAVNSKSEVSLKYVLPGVALLLADQGQIERAVELYALASR